MPTTGTAAPLVRDASHADMAAVQEIYAHHVRHGVATFEEVPPSAAEMRERRTAILGLGLPYLVAESAGRIVGYCYAGTYRPRPAYRHTIENSVYVASDAGGRGIGTALMTTLIARCSREPWRQMLAIIGGADNHASIALHAHFGFTHVGVLHAVGFKLGRWVDSVVMQRALGDGDRSAPGHSAR